MPKWLLTSLRLATATSHDAAGRLTQAEPAAGTVTFTYNADHQRVAKQSTDGSTTGYLYDYKRLLEETDGAGGSVDVTYTTTTDEEYGSLIGEDGDGGQLYHQYDAQWSTNVLQDDTGDVEGQYKYTAFGLPEPAPAIAPPSNFMAFGQKQYYTDVETNLYLLGGGTNGRYYDPATGRFVSEDPIRHAGGDDNLVVYVRNDPVNKVDPSGQDDTVEAQEGRVKHRSIQEYYEKTGKVETEALIVRTDTSKGRADIMEEDALASEIGPSSFSGLTAKIKDIQRIVSRVRERGHYSF